MKFVEAPLYIREMIVIGFILSLVLSIIGVFITIRLCKKSRYIVISIITFILSFVFVFLTMRGSYRYRVNLSVFEPSLTIIMLPLWIHCLMVILLFIFSMFVMVYAFKWRKSHISILSIKESCEKLKAGICFYEENGLIRLINNEMNNLCLYATKEALLNGITFWDKISQGMICNNCEVIKKGIEPIIGYSDGKIISFKKYVHQINNKNIYEIVAIDITKQYSFTKELDQKLHELKMINKQLIEYGESIAEITCEKELLMAKIRVHDDIGKIMLTTKHKLSEDINDSDKKSLLEFWYKEISSLKNVHKNVYEDKLQTLKEIANLIGVNIIIYGEKPKKNTMNEKIFITAIHECLTNTVSHANGKTMFVYIESINNHLVITINNDGDKPKNEIVEKGGLSGLRTLVEKACGKMTIYSKPEFNLIINLPLGE